jgi:hypothetical protein
MWKLCETALVPLALGKMLTSTFEVVKDAVKRNAQMVSLLTTVCIVTTPWVSIRYEYLPVTLMLKHSDTIILSFANYK